MSTDRLSDHAIALITGAGSGIGLAIARRLAARGCRVVLAGRRKERLAAAARDIGARALAWPLDLTDRSAVDAVADALPAEFRPLSILVNCAGHDVGGRRQFVDGSAADWSDIIDTNVQGLFRMTRAVLPAMLSAGRGDIVNIGSASALHPVANLAAYASAKAAVHMFSDTLRSETAGSGVRVIEILPGPVDTDFALTRFRGDKTKADEFAARFKHPLSADDVAASVVYALQQPAHVTIAQIVMTPSSLR